MSFKSMVTRKSWEQFRNTGLLLLLNQFLHIFGWAIVYNIENGKVVDVYPARVKFRGFDGKVRGRSIHQSYQIFKEVD